MRKRAIAVSGDMSTSKPPARIIGTGRGKIRGLNMILERDRFQCPACNTTGHIICIGPRNVMNEIHAGQARAVALHGDICCCACEPKPRLNAVSQHVAHHILADEIAARHIQPESSPHISKVSTSYASTLEFPNIFNSHDEQLRINLSDGSPLTEMSYTLYLEDGREVSGYLNHDGKTSRVISDKPVEILSITLEVE